MVAALIIVSTIVATTPVEARTQSVQWTWHGSPTVTTGDVVRSPNGDLYVHSNIGSVTTIFAISPDGKDLWNVNVTLDSTPQFGPDGTMFILVHTSNTTVNGTGLLALTPAGTTEWSFAIPGVSEGLQALPDGGVVLGAEPRYPGQFSLVCLNADGGVRWTKGAYDANSSNTVMYPVGVRGYDVLVATTSDPSPTASVITEYRPDGTSLRSFGTDFQPQGIVFALDGTMRTIGFNYSRNTGSEQLYGLNFNGSVMWAVPTNNVKGDLAVLADGTTVYAEQTDPSGLNFNVFAVDANGNTLWSVVNLKSIPVAFGSGVLLADPTALRLVDRDGGVIWTLNGIYYGQPVVAGKNIYIGSGSNLVALSETAWTLTWQPAVLVLTIMVAMIGVYMLSGITPKPE